MFESGRPARGSAPVAFAIFTVMLTVVACGDSVTQLGPNDVVAVRLSPDSALLTVGKTLSMRALPLDSTGALIVGLGAA